ncbi:MAG: hypothetical protein ABJA67_15850 [Chthonomonadales bacterium]
MATPLIVGLAMGLVYGSFLEWFIHKVVMHSTSISQLAFDRHAIEHHVQRRSLKTFYIAPEEDDKYHLLESSVIPLLWFGHLPVYIAVGYFYNVWAGIGVATSGMLYLLGYEFIHFFIHVPKGHWFQRTRLFRFYCEYHRVHHHKAKINYNIVIPFADFVLRTQTFEYIRVEPSRPEFVKPDTGPSTVWQSKENTTSVQNP